MTFAAFEESREDGQPIEFYDFGLANEQFNYTTAEHAILLDGVMYQPIAVQRSSIRLGTEARQDILNVIMPANIAPASRYISIVPGVRGTLTIRRQHSTDGLTPETLVIFKGVIRSVGFLQNGYQSELAVVPISSGLGRELPRFTYQSLCNHILYDNGCKVNQGNFDIISTATAVSGNTLTVTGLDAQANGFYTAGFAQLGTTDFRLILSHTGNNIELLLPFASEAVGQQVTVFAGCDHTIQTCQNKFDNVDNYGGFAFVPLRNIFANGI